MEASQPLTQQDIDSVLGEHAALNLNAIMYDLNSIDILAAEQVAMDYQEHVPILMDFLMTAVRAALSSPTTTGEAAPELVAPANPLEGGGAEEAIEPSFRFSHSPYYAVMLDPSKRLDPVYFPCNSQEEAEGWRIQSGKKKVVMTALEAQRYQDRLDAEDNEPAALSTRPALPPAGDTVGAAESRWVWVPTGFRPQVGKAVEGAVQVGDEEFNRPMWVYWSGEDWFSSEPGSAGQRLGKYATVHYYLHVAPKPIKPAFPRDRRGPDLPPAPPLPTTPAPTSN